MWRVPEFPILCPGDWIGTGIALAGVAIAWFWRR